MLKEMTLPERSAWVMMLVLVLAGFHYAAPVICALLDGASVPDPGWMIIGYVVIVVVLSVMGQVIIAAVDPESASEPPDERDKLVAWRAGHVSGVVFGVLIIACLLHYLSHGSGDLLFHAVFISLIVAQIAEYALTVIGYCRLG